MILIPRKEIIWIVGDLNGLIGTITNRMEMAEIGKFGVESRNKNGQRIVDIFLSTVRVALNITFTKEENRRVTCKSGGDGPRCTLYYVKEEIKNGQKIAKCHLKKQ